MGTALAMAAVGILAESRIASLVSARGNLLVLVYWLTKLFPFADLLQRNPVRISSTQSHHPRHINNTPLYLQNLKSEIVKISTIISRQLMQVVSSTMTTTIRPNLIRKNLKKQKRKSNLKRRRKREMMKIIKMNNPIRNPVTNSLQIFTYNNKTMTMRPKKKKKRRRRNNPTSMNIMIPKYLKMVTTEMVEEVSQRTMAQSRMTKRKI